MAGQQELLGFLGPGTCHQALGEEEPGRRQPPALGLLGFEDRDPGAKVGLGLSDPAEAKPGLAQADQRQGGRHAVLR